MARTGQRRCICSEPERGLRIVNRFANLGDKRRLAYFIIRAEPKEPKSARKPAFAAQVAHTAKQREIVLRHLGRATMVLVSKHEAEGLRQDELRWSAIHRRGFWRVRCFALLQVTTGRAWPQRRRAGHWHGTGPSQGRALSLARGGDGANESSSAGRAGQGAGAERGGGVVRGCGRAPVPLVFRAARWRRGGRGQQRRTSTGGHCRCPWSNRTRTEAFAGARERSPRCVSVGQHPK